MTLIMQQLEATAQKMEIVNILRIPIVMRSWATEVYVLARRSLFLALTTQNVFQVSPQVLNANTDNPQLKDFFPHVDILSILIFTILFIYISLYCLSLHYAKTFNELPYISRCFSV